MLEVIAKAASATALIRARNQLRNEIGQAIQDEGQHTDVHFKAQEFRIVSESAVLFYCRGCGKWGKVACSPEARVFFGFAAPAARLDEDGLDRFELWCRNELIPGARRFAESRCFTYAARAEVAQWVTEQVRDAGPEGISEWELTRLNEEERMAPPLDLEDVIEAMGWSNGGPMVLPIGHPYRSW